MPHYAPVTLARPCYPGTYIRPCYPGTYIRPCYVPLLGTGNVGACKDQQFLSFKTALVYARSLKLKNVKEWQAWSKSSVREANIPAGPHSFYKHEGWQGYGHCRVCFGVGFFATDFLHDAHMIAFGILCLSS